MSRHYCSICRYPQNACLCASVQPISPMTQLVVLQHPSEVEHKKNSVRVLSLAVPKTQVYVGESESDFKGLREYLAACNMPIYLVYPSALSVSVEQQRINPDCILLLLDGTWRKAFKMLQLNPWLTQYPAVHLAEGYESRYRIRKSSRSDSLSTLEACAYMLSALDPTLDVQPLMMAFDAMVELRIKAMPSTVQVRYQNSNESSGKV
ncbi:MULTISPECIES: tRNA-uridine aminocarboxypropyltransferase [unclassified Shewanella]|uniref:tRNA-uridine aminocarboxypropyltransferase n=1 Tax=Shewanella TaxID=22 RepID=UPI0021DB1653|nr:MULTISPECIES: tRNA-uridine aminocarboxypropyltransferase [unclassified Shewanella]MCU7976823.1 DTW domain-containing protein [Shewanella sp. SW36]MCU7986683.1 DTW domain-containing protein [Shewanella sp. SW24]MCU7992063.1 DTW domain-containing protein [Shewanella sp. SW1]MCU8015176.1 DTW domain-containing protein [Shewanella sp. SM74]MCU8018714.1 DTW domain-containing protein [Shewanella sp. SM72]